MRNILLGLVIAASLRAETGYDAWLRYSPRTVAAPSVVSEFGNSAVLDSARGELIRGVRGVAGKTLRLESGVPKEPAILLGTLPSLQQAVPQWRLSANLAPDAYWLKTVSINGVRFTVVTVFNQ